MKTGATDEDVANIEAWAEIIEDVLACAPYDKRAAILEIAATREASQERDEHGLPRLAWRASELHKQFLNSSRMGNLNVIMRLKAVLIQRFVRNITNNHSTKDAAAILFAHQRHGHGSGNLADYIDDLPRQNR